ncbi:MAG: substrate-binding domain-containing protein, partial [Nitrososphaeraceae archaeon]
EQGQLDAVAAYKHEAVARGLPFITLPAEINLADPTFSNFYKTASYTLENGEGQTVLGEPIYFSFAIPNTAKNLDGAISFATFILSTNGENILEEDGLNFIKPVAEGNVEKVPTVIRDILKEEEQESIQQQQQQLNSSANENSTRS